MLLGFRKPGFLEKANAQGGVHASVAGVSLQRFFPIRLGLLSRAMELLDALPRQIQLLDGLDVFGRRRPCDWLRHFGRLKPHRRVGNQLSPLNRDGRAQIVFIDSRRDRN